MSKTTTVIEFKELLQDITSKFKRFNLIIKKKSLKVEDHYLNCDILEYKENFLHIKSRGTVNICEDDIQIGKSIEDRWIFIPESFLNSEDIDIHIINLDEEDSAKVEFSIINNYEIIKKSLSL